MSINTEFSLSFDNIRSIPFDKYEKNFTFIVNGTKYETSRFIADILSPIIRKCHYSDETIDEFNININTDGKIPKCNDFFLDFLKLTQFKKSNLDSFHQMRYSEYFLKLGNIDAYLQLRPEPILDLTPENIIDFLKINMGFHEDLSKYYSEKSEILKKNGNFDLDQMINYAAVHFEEISKVEMKTLPDEVIEQIISNKFLRLTEEDDLLLFILDLYKENRKYSNLFEYVMFNNVSKKEFEKFIVDFSPEYINSKIWNSICQRFLQDKESESFSERYSEKIIKLKHKEGKDFHGIMRYLTEQTGGNIHDNGTIEITSNSVYNNDNSPRNLVDYQNDNYYESEGNKNAEICFDFKNNQIQLDSYSIKSHYSGPNNGHLKSWVIEMSNDGQNWSIVDEHLNDTILNSSSITASFSTKKLKNFYRFIRLRQTGPNWNGNYLTYFRFIEFYGKLKQNMDDGVNKI